MDAVVLICTSHVLHLHHQVQVMFMCGIPPLMWNPPLSCGILPFLCGIPPSMWNPPLACGFPLCIKINYSRGSLLRFRSLSLRVNWRIFGQLLLWAMLHLCGWSLFVWLFRSRPKGTSCVITEIYPNSLTLQDYISLCFQPLQFIFGMIIAHCRLYIRQCD